YLTTADSHLFYITGAYLCTKSTVVDRWRASKQPSILRAKNPKSKENSDSNPIKAIWTSSTGALHSLLFFRLVILRFILLISHKNILMMTDAKVYSCNQS